MKKYKDIGQTPQPPLGGAPRLMRLIGLIGFLALLGLVACSDDSSEGRGRWVKLELIPYYNIYKVSEEGTRGERNTTLFGATDGAGPYVPYASLNPQADPSQAAIHVYLTTAEGTQPETEGNFTFHAAEDTKPAYWSSGVWVKEVGTTYYVYGFMPASAARNASITPKTNFNNQAILHLNGLDAVTPADVCVVVGVKGLTKEDHGGETTTPIAESGITVGSYSYMGYPSLADDPTKGNYIYLLLDHLYSCLNLEYQVSPEYYKLRSIKLRKVEVKVTGAGATKRNLTVTIPGEDATFDVNDVTAGGTSDIAVVFDRTSMTEGTEIPSTSWLSVPGYFTPAVDNEFVIISTYDVYDRKGNLIRANQTATNTITSDMLLGSHQAHTHERGKMHTLRLTIVPTYLYQLSDGDLDNPVIKLTGNS